MKTYPEDQAILFAKHISTAFQAEQAIIIATDGVTVQGASYGKTKLDCKFAGQLLDKILNLLKCRDISLTADQQREYEYRFNERLGILAGTATPTHEQTKIANQEALEAVLLL